MMKLSDHRVLAALTMAALAAAAAALTPRTQSFASPSQCGAPAEFTHFERPLVRTARLIANGKPINVVTIGSSSTAGAGASSDAATYPSRLEAELKQRFPLGQFKVINRGVGGTEIPDMLARFDAYESEDRPDLVLWQLGTNSLLRDRVITEAGNRINEGLSKFKAVGADVILVNPQYAPKVIAKPEVEHMVKIITATARQANVNLFDRFAVMRYWRLAQNIPFSEFLSPDELHMNDWSYACIAKLLANGIKDAATRPAQTATTTPAR
jgi:acyl-CoA thioesterase I